MWPSIAALLIALWCAVTPAAAASLNLEVRDLAGHLLPDAVAFVEPLGAVPHRPARQPRTTVDQVNKEFLPLVSIVQTGTEVSFPNSDHIRHSIYSFSPAKVFTAKLYSGTQAPPVVFDNSGLVVLGCNIHDTMVAWIVVVDTPYFAKTGADGAVVISGMEAGDYRLSVWYPGPTFEPHVEQIHISDAVQHREVRLDTTGSPLPAVNARVRDGR